MNNQWIRKVELLVTSNEKALDLSQFRITFSVRNADVESPNNAAIRVYNLSPLTVKKIREEFKGVILNAGYEQGNFGAIFKGTIKQYRIGRENATDTYLDILAADGDIGYTQGIVNATLAKGSTTEQAIKESVKAMPDLQYANDILVVDNQHHPSIRGQVLMGMARSRLRNYANTLDATWSIQNGQVVMITKSGYLEGEAVKINVGTGLIGMPEQTGEGIKLKCLLNSRIRIGGLIQLNNDEIVQLMQSDPNAAPIPYDQWASFQPNTKLTDDGIYRAFVVEHEGDSRGRAWHSSLVCLAADVTAEAKAAVKAP